MLWERRIPGDDLRRADEIQPRGRQQRHVQRLADMAGGIRPIRMLVEQSAARGKKEQRGASQQRQRAAHEHSSEDGPLRLHQATLQLSTLDGRTSRLVANKAPKEVNGLLDPATIRA